MAGEVSVSNHHVIMSKRIAIGIVSFIIIGALYFYSTMEETDSQFRSALRQKQTDLAKRNQELQQLKERMGTEEEELNELYNLVKGKDDEELSFKDLNNLRDKLTAMTVSLQHQKTLLEEKEVLVKKAEHDIRQVADAADDLLIDMASEIYRTNGTLPEAYTTWMQEDFASLVNNMGNNTDSSSASGSTNLRGN